MTVRQELNSKSSGLFSLHDLKIKRNFNGEVSPGPLVHITDNIKHAQDCMVV